MPHLNERAVRRIASVLVRCRRVIGLGGVAFAVLATTFPAFVSAAPPKLNGLFPPGGARGQKVVVNAAGEFTQWPVEFRADRPGVSISAMADKGKLEIQVAPDAIPGIYWLRAVDGEGASTLRPFLVGLAREVEEVEPNDSVEQGQLVELPVTIHGRVGKGGDVDGFVVPLKVGQSLVASLVAQTPLGSPMDAVLQVAELVGGTDGGASGVAAGSAPVTPTGVTPTGAAPTGVAGYKFPRRREAYVLEHCDDETGLDPRLTFVAPRDGLFLVRVFAFPAEPNSSIAFAGAENYVYQLTLTTTSFVDVVLPLARPLAEPRLPVRFADGRASGGLSEAEWSPLLPEFESWGASERPVSWVFHPAATGHVAVPWTPHPSLVATDAALVDMGQEVAAPTVISGLLSRPRAKATFRMTATKGQKWNIRVDARSLGFALDPIITVTDSMGKQLAENDDAGNQRDSQLTFTAPADGVHLVSIRDVHGAGGPRHAYRLTIEPAQPDFRMTLAADAFALVPGKALEIPVTIERLEGFAEAVDLKVEGLPSGVSLAPVRSEPMGDSAKSVKLILNADPAAFAKPVHATIRVVGLTMGEPMRRRVATFAVPGAPLPLCDPWLTVTAAPTP